MKYLVITICFLITVTTGFQCKNSGVFPDRDDCARFHMCHSNLGHQEINCGSSSYDQKLGHCNDAKVVSCDQIAKRDIDGLFSKF